MRFYYDKKTKHLVIVGKREELPSVTFVDDRGKGDLRNIFGGKLERYLFHCSSVNEGYSTQTDKIDFLMDDMTKKRVYLRRK